MKNRRNIWFTSDLHIGHENVIRFCDRPFDDAEQMKEVFIKNYNELVGPEDTCIFVGDIFLYHTPKEMRKILDRMNGKKILVRGNHDLKHSRMISGGFYFSVDKLTLKIADEYVEICHFPFAMRESLVRWIRFKNFFRKIVGLHRYKIEKYHDKRPKDSGGFIIHGHTHSKEKVRGKMIHVGVDAWDYKPVSIDVIGNLIEQIKKNEK